MKHFEEVTENFEKMVSAYIKYVGKKIETQNKIENEEEDAVLTGSTNDDAMILMNEVRTANVITVTLTRMNGKENKERALYSEN